MSFSVGETVGPYRIIEQLGQGSMATVNKAYHAALDRYVLLKVLHPAFLEEQNFLARFQREARLLQAEFNAKQGQTDSARNLLTALLDDKTISDWNRPEASLILSQLP
jgi:serine/threonine protein kinase